MIKINIPINRLRSETADAKSTPSYSSDLHFLSIVVIVRPMMTISVLSSKILDLPQWGHIASLLTFFIRHIALSTFLFILELFQTILEHINTSLLGLYWKTEKCRSEN